MAHGPLEHAGEKTQKIRALPRRESVGILRAKNQKAGEPTCAEIEPQAGLGFEPDRVVSVNPLIGGLHLAERDFALRRSGLFL